MDLIIVFVLKFFPIQSNSNNHILTSNPRDGGSLVIDGVWYIFGGDNGRNFLSDVEAFDPKGKSFNLAYSSLYVQ